MLLPAVAFMIAAIVTPWGCPSRARTAACLVPAGRTEGVIPDFTGSFARLLVCASFVLLGVLRCDILGSLSVCDGFTFRHHRDIADRRREDDLKAIFLRPLHLAGRVIEQDRHHHVRC
jgi:hypothetical protein